MEQEKHLTEQAVRKSVTKATARHLRRKRLKDARRAEERQYLDILNGVSSQQIKGEEETNGTTTNSADINHKSTLTPHQTALVSANLNKFSHSSVNLSDPLNDLTIAAILKKLASLEKSHAEQANVPLSHCSSNVVDEARCVNGTEDLSQMTNDKKKRKKKKKRAKSPLVSATLEEDSNASSSHSESSVSNLNCDSNCSASKLDSDSVENGQVLEQSVPMDVVDSSQSIPNDIEIKSDQVDMSATNYFASRLLANTSAESKREETNTSSSTFPAVSTAEETFHSPAEAREEMNAQHGMKKAAKMKANKAVEPTNSGNNGIRNKSSTANDKSPRKSSETEAVKDAATSSRKTDVAADSQSSQPARKTESKQRKNNIQNGLSVASKNEKSTESLREPVCPTKKSDEKICVPENTREEVKAEHEKKKSTKTKAKSKKTAENTGRDNNDVRFVTSNCASLSESVETRTPENVTGDSRKAVVVDDVQISESARESEPKQNAVENRTQSESIATFGSDKSGGFAQKPVSSIRMTDEQCSLPGKTNPTTDSQDSQSVRETEPKQIMGQNDIQDNSTVISKSEESNASLREPVPSMNTADDKSSLSGKTRDEIKAEREVKKAAKAAAKAKAKNKKTEETADNVKNDTTNELLLIGHEVSIGSAATKPVVTDTQSDVTATTSQSPQTAKKVEESSKESVTQQPPTIQPVSAESSAISRQDSAISNAKNEGKSKAELRAERRAKQETQRAAKQLQQSAAKQQEASAMQQLPSTSQQSFSTKKDARNQKVPLVKPRAQQAAGESATAKRVARRDNDHEVNLFKHLYNERELSLTSVPVNLDIHPAIIGLGAQYANRTIVGSNARCVALLEAVKQVIQDFVKPEQTDFTRSLEACLRDLLTYLHCCRPVAVSMQNAMRHLKWHMATSPITMSTDEAKTKLIGIIDTYITEQIELAGKAISITIQTKISNGDIILIYGYSSLICNILVDAHAADKQFRVIVVDGRPWLEGREQLRRLAKHGINCSYMFINAVSFIMPEVSKVFLGAHAILANGAVMSRVGTSQIALIAKAFNVPVLVACETHKTCGRVQTDSIVYNELGDADNLVNSYQGSNSRKSLLTNWRARKSLNLLNITYDVTPADLITAVVTELAILPCTSVPVILRIKPTEF